MSERDGSDVRWVLDIILDPTTTDEFFEEEVWQFCNLQMPKDAGPDVIRKYAVLLLLDYQEGTWLVNADVQDIIKLELGHEISPETA